MSDPGDTRRLSLRASIRSLIRETQGLHPKPLGWGFALTAGSIPAVDYRHISAITAGGERLPLTRALVEPALSLGIQWLGGQTACCIYLPEALYGHADDEPLPYLEAFLRAGASPPLHTEYDTAIEIVWDAGTVRHYEPVFLLEERPKNWPR